MNERICKYCECKFTELTGRQFANHVRWCDKNITNGDKGSKSIADAVNKRHDIRLGAYKDFTLICANTKCQKSFIHRCRELNLYKAPKCCSSVCSHALSASAPRNWTVDMKKKASDITSSLWDNEEYSNKCINNSNAIFSSKGETEIKKHFVNTYKFDEWTSGGNLKYKDGRLIRDLYSNKLKICIEYDGIWHFKDIKGQLNHKQRIDMLLEEWCIDNNWRLIRIDEDVYNKNKSDAINILIDCVYNKTNQIIKIGDRY